MTALSVIWFIINYLFDQERAVFSPTQTTIGAYTLLQIGRKEVLRYLSSSSSSSHTAVYFFGWNENSFSIKFGLEIPSSSCERKQLEQSFSFDELRWEWKHLPFIQILKAERVALKTSQNSNLAPFRVSETPFFLGRMETKTGCVW